MVQVFNKKTVKLGSAFNLYFSLFAFEIPRFTVEETDTTQAFIQSPI